MHQRIAIVSSIALIAAGASWATSARVEAMGKHDTYFMDDISVWSNPANANIYPNYLMGELGQMRQNGKPVNSGSYNALDRYNTDPSQPWFGAIFAKSLGSDPQGGNRYPQIVLGGALNRRDDLLAYIPTKVLGVNGSTDTLFVAQPRTNADLLVSMATNSGVLLGVSTYIAINDSEDVSSKYKSQSYVYKATLGANVPVSQGLDVEATVGIASIGYDASKDGNSYTLGSDLSLLASARAFVAAPIISGEFVPAFSFKQIDAPATEETSFRVGIGANVSLDRGFFWIGGDYFNTSTTNRFQVSGSKVLTIGVPSSSAADKGFETTEQGGRVSFGIERNVWWDWFVLRVGGQKVISSVEQTFTGSNKAKRSYWTTNPEGDGLPDDHVSFGFGLNIEDKLKVDAVVAEDILFTGGNLLGGPADHVFSRISATYSF